VVETHLRAALDRGWVNLGRVAAIVRTTAPADIESVVRRKPTGVFARRLWFLYEWLTGRKLDVPEPAGRLRFVPVLNPARQVALEFGVPSGRHRVIDNLPGTAAFCPTIRWTPALRAASAEQWNVRIRRIVASISPDHRPAIASRLQRNEAESSFVLAGREPTDPGTVRWADAIGHAGVRVLTLDELLRLQRRACGASSAHLGLRRASSLRSDVESRPGDCAGARAEDLDSLVHGLIDFADRAVSGAVDPVIAAAALAFGFLHIRPFATANGQLHRWLVHYTLDTAGFTSPGFVLPISAAMVRRLEEYRDVSTCPEPADAYRFADMTRHAEFLYSCLEDCVERDLYGSARIIAGSVETRA